MHLEDYGECFKKYDLTNYNTYKIKCIADTFIIVNDVVKLTKLIKFLTNNNIKYFILGGGSNIILPERYKGVIIKPNFTSIVVDKTKLIVGSSVYLNRLINVALKNDLTGLEWAGGIPGTIGGSIIGNAGAYNDQIMNYVESVEVLENNKVKILKKKEIEYSYRNTSLKNKDVVVISAILYLKKGNKSESESLMKDRLERRISSQPLDYPSAGSVFRNPDGDYAGRLLEELNFKGYCTGGAMISNKHANFIINYHNATSKNIKKLIKTAHDAVLKEYGIDLILEQQIIV